MKPVFEKTPQCQWESFHCEVVRARGYNAAWHWHPELQITLVLRSNGYRMVGDKITPLKAGDLVLLGANLPHVWHEETTNASRRPEVHAIIVRFLETFAGRDFLELPELVPVRRLFQRARRGLEITGGTRAEAAARLEQLPELSGLARLTALLAILELLARSRELKPIASAGFVPSFAADDQDRMQRVTAFIHAHLSEPIDRAEVAQAAHLSAGAFSRFFRLRTGKTLPEYLNELRVGRACRLLADERTKVADVALDCGFHNLANFNRTFRRIMQLTPREYRRQLGDYSELQTMRK